MPPPNAALNRVVASPARQFANVGSLTSKRVVYLPWSTFPANLKISMIPARRNGRRGKPLMVIVTRGRGRIDTLCQMLCRFHAQITQQQRHRLRASQTTGIAKCPQRNSSRTIKQRPCNDRALYAPARQRVKFARSVHPPAPVGLVALMPFPSSDNGLKTTHTRRQFAGELRESRVLAVIHFCSSARCCAICVSAR